MWYACIACPSVFDTQSELQKHYLRPSRKDCRPVFVLRNRLKHRQGHQLPADRTRRHRPRAIGKGAEYAEDGFKSNKFYFCTICSATFEDGEAHKKTHQAETPGDGHLRDIRKLYNCAQLVQTQDAQVKCPYCDNVLPTNKRLKGHIILMHPEVRKTLLNLIKEIESFNILSKSEDENDEAAGPSSKTTNLPHFSIQDYDSSDIPNWAVELQKLTFVSQVLYTNASNSSQALPNTSNQVPATVLPLETEGSPRSTSSLKENVTEASRKEQSSLGPLNVQIEASSSGVQTRSRSQGPSPVVISGPSQPATLPKKSKPNKKRLYHRCFFCAELFPKETQYLVHVMFNHTNPETKEERKKLAEYTEILATRLEIESISSPDRSRRKDSTSIDNDLSMKRPIEETQNQEQGLKEPETKKARLSTKAVLILEDVGDQILMDCPACSESVPLSRRISHMEAHLNRADSSEPTCLICGDKTKDLMCLKEHASEHFKVKPFSCEQCWNGFSRRAILKLHMTRVHGEIRKQPKKLKKRKA